MPVVLVAPGRRDLAHAQETPDARPCLQMVAVDPTEDVEDPLRQKIRSLDKLVDELAGGKSMDKVLRS